MTTTHRGSSSKRRRRGLIVIGIGLLLLAGLGIYAYLQLAAAKDDINRATASATELQTALEAGDQPGAERSLSSLQANIGDADSTLGGLVFSAAAKLPVVGKNIDAARTVTSSLDRVVASGLPPLVEIADQFNGKTFNPQDGAIDLAAIEAIGPNVTESAAVIGDASSDVDAIDASSLIGSLQGPVEDVQDKLGHAAAVARRATTASSVMPALLSGKHRYLLLFQNNAEIRATGGLPGAYAVLEVDDGTITLGQQGAGGSMGELAYQATAISPEETELYDIKMVSDFRDINFTPDFPRAAEIGAAIFGREKGVDVDGIISLDPVTLSYLLKGIGPVEVEGGTTLTPDNAVDVLLNEVYQDYAAGDDQDAFFAAATGQIFERVISGAGDPTTVLKALTRATDERRVAMWVKDPEINEQIAGTSLAHELPSGDEATPALGFYLNDATGAKMQYYLDSTVTGTSTRCTDQGVQSYDTEMTLTSSAPADAASLPASIQGPGFGAQPGSMLMNLYVYAPAGGSVDSISFDGEDVEFFIEVEHEGRPVALTTVQVDPGQVVKVGAKITSGAKQDGVTAVTTTPSIKPGASTQTWKSSC